MMAGSVVDRRLIDEAELFRAANLPRRWHAAWPATQASPWKKCANFVDYTDFYESSVTPLSDNPGNEAAVQALVRSSVELGGGELRVFLRLFDRSPRGLDAMNVQRSIAGSLAFALAGAIAFALIAGTAFAQSNGDSQYSWQPYRPSSSSHSTDDSPNADDGDSQPAQVRPAAYNSPDNTVYLDQPPTAATSAPAPGGPIIYSAPPAQCYGQPAMAPSCPCGPSAAAMPGCDSCGNGNSYRMPQLWYASVEGTFLAVTRHGPPGVDIVTDPSPPQQTDDPSTNEFNTSYGVGPRVTVGVELPDCWGVRGRFWSFRDNADGDVGNPAVLNGVGTGSFATGSYDLSAYTIDVELTKSWDLEACGIAPWLIEASFGARYAQMRQDADLGFFDSTDETAAFGSASRRISGTGLTASIEAHRNLGCSGWNVFANARGSVLWGSTDGLATMAAVTYFGFDSFASDSSSLDKSTTMYIVEAQAGVEWTKPIKCICGTAFVRAAGEYQRWTADGAGSAVASGAAVGDTLTTTVTSTTPSTTVGLLGLDIAAGFRF